MHAGLMFFVTVWTAIGALLGFCVVGIVEQADRWWQERKRNG
jgi:hypothetical protein